MIQVSGLALDTAGGLSTMRFDRFGLEQYALFLRCKALPESQTSFDHATEAHTVSFPSRFLANLGIAPPADPRPDLPFCPMLFDYQRFIAGKALDSRRYAVYADCGLGKTPISQEFARQVAHRTDGAVVVFQPKAVIPQYIEEAAKFYGSALPIQRLETRAELVEWCRDGRGVGIANYHKLVDGQIPEMRRLAGLVCDESSILKSGGGTIKWNLIKSARGVEYKLSCTATPAPNEIMEYASQASFLEKLKTESDILWTFFSRDKRGNWAIKPHAKAAFYRFLASWSIYLRNPAAYGFADNLAELPPPEFIDHQVEPTDEQLAFQRAICMNAGAGLLADRALGVTQRTKLSEAAKGFVYQGKTVRRISSRKPRAVADLIRQEVAAGHQVLVWTLFDEEARILMAEYGGGCCLDGAVAEDDRDWIVEEFRCGRIPVLFSKASMLGFGLNFQNCTSMIFSGFADSYEQFYQAVRRAYRYGQSRSVRIHTVWIDELEGPILQNILAKKASFERDAAEQEYFYRQALEGIAA